MAPFRHPAARPTVGALTGLVLILGALGVWAPRPSRAEAPAPADQSLPPLPARASAPATVFWVHRVENPSYRVPLPISPTARARNLAPATCVDHLRLRTGLRSAAGDPGPRDWEVDTGRAWGERSAVSFRASGVQGEDIQFRGSTWLRGIALEARRGGLAAVAGDLLAETGSGLGRLDRLRGGGLRHSARDHSVWRIFAGKRAPGPGAGNAVPVYAGASLEGKPAGVVFVSGGVLGFASPAGAANPLAPAPDSSGGRGATLWGATTVSRGPALLGFDLAAQGHDLDQRFRFGLRPAASLRATLGALAFTTRQEFSGPAFRVPTTDGLRRAGTHLGQYGARVRIGPRAEAHAGGDHQTGGDPGLAGGSFTVGGSAELTGSAIHVAGEGAWSRRGSSPGDRRLLLQASRVSVAGLAWVAHALHSWSPGSPARFQVQAEVSRAAHGARLGLESRLEWRAAAVDRGALSMQLSRPLPLPGAALWASLGVAAERDLGFRPGLSEASVRVTFTPGSRDRLEPEAERVSDVGISSVAFAAEYSIEAPRYPGAPGAADSAAAGSRVVARVVHAEGGAGIENVLVSLDGREFRFTDADGRAVFEGVAAGPHEVAVEETSLPAGERALGGARLPLRVEARRATDPVFFEVGRPERRTRFPSAP